MLDAGCWGWMLARMLDLTARLHDCTTAFSTIAYVRAINCKTAKLQLSYFSHFMGHGSVFRLMTG